MAIVLKPYTNSPIQPGSVVTSKDYLELKENAQRILEGFNRYIPLEPDDPTKTMHVKSIGSAQHSLATSTEAGFADPDVVFMDPDNPTGTSLQELAEKVDEALAKYQYDAYPELSIVPWGGSSTDTLPSGWYLCNGQEITLIDGTKFKTPDLQCCIPVTVTQHRVFLSRHTELSRSLKKDSEEHATGDAMTKPYIIKAPIITQPMPMVTLKVVQPEGLRIATNYTTCDPAILDTLPTGYIEEVEIPLGAKVIVSRIRKDNYALVKIVKNNAYSSNIIPLNKPVSIYEDNVIQIISLDKLVDYVSPTLTWNGVLGLSTNAIISYGDGSPIEESYYLMDKTNTFRYWSTQGNITEARIIFYTLNGVKATKIKIQMDPGTSNQPKQYINDIIIKGSNDGMNWETMGSTSPGEVLPDQLLEIPVTSSKSYAYLLIDFVGGKINVSDYTAIKDIEIVGKAETRVNYDIVTP